MYQTWRYTPQRNTSFDLDLLLNLTNALYRAGGAKAGDCSSQEVLARATPGATGGRVTSKGRAVGVGTSMHEGRAAGEGRSVDERRVMTIGRVLSEQGHGLA